MENSCKRNVQTPMLLKKKRCISDEFKNYCSDSSESMLKQSSPVGLEAFSNKFLVSEVRQWCPGVPFGWLVHQVHAKLVYMLNGCTDDVTECFADFQFDKCFKILFYLPESHK